MKCVLLFVVGLATAMAFPAELASASVAETSVAETSVFTEAYRFLQGCGEKDMSLCIKMRALTYVDRALRRSGDVELVDGVALVRSGDAENARETSGRALSEEELDASLPQDAEQKDQQVDSLLVDRVARFFQSHTLQLKVPDAAISEVRKTLDEARGKKKKLKMLLPLLLLAKLKAAVLIPLALGGLALLALKALVVAKIALVIAGLIALKKLLHKDHHSQSYEVVAHPQYSSHGDEHHGHGHHYGRALPSDAADADAQQLAYNAYAKQE